MQSCGVVHRLAQADALGTVARVGVALNNRLLRTVTPTPGGKPHGIDRMGLLVGGKVRHDAPPAAAACASAASSSVICAAFQAARA